MGREASNKLLISGLILEPLALWDESNRPDWFPTRRCPGGLLLMLNSVLGMCWDVPEQRWIHVLWFHGNLVFTGLTGVSLAHALAAPVGGPWCPPRTHGVTTL